MTEKRVFYQVSDRNYDSFYEHQLTGTNLLTVAEEEAKKQTSNQNTRYIHRHTLEVLKTFKVEDKPKQTQLNKHTCKYEKCTKAVVLDGKNSGSSVLFEYCHTHIAIIWHGKLSRKFAVIGKYQERPEYLMPKIAKSKALKLLKIVVDYHENCDGYSSLHEGARTILVQAVGNAGMRPATYPRYQAKSMEPHRTDTIFQMCYTIVEAGGLV